MSWELLVSQLLPGVIKLAWETMAAIVAGKPELAARKAEEAARRQAVKMGVDAVLRARK